MIRTRFAPSPTGDLHLGGVWTALASWVLARRAGGAFVLRMEDLDPPRVVRGSSDRILEDLQWLGLTWDEGPFAQSDRGAIYEAVLAALAQRGLTYPCDCSRTEIAQVASAPHAGEETVYPGLCRDREARTFKRDPALRLRLPTQCHVEVEDAALGVIAQDLPRDVGDFVLRRGDGVFAYQLAVVVDDLAMGITDVVRGADLASSTPRQVHLARLLGGTPPRFVHLPLVVAADGARLAKRSGGAQVRALRSAGFTAPQILGALAHGLGFTPDDSPRSAGAIAEATRGRDLVWPRDSWRIPASWAKVQNE